MKMLKKILLTVFLLLGLPTLASPSITNIKAMHYHPWGKVALSYELSDDIAINEEEMPKIHIIAKDIATGRIYEAYENYISGDVGAESGHHCIFWDISAQGLSFNSNQVVFRITYYCSDAIYLVVNLSGGPSASNYPISFLYEDPSGGWSDEYKTTKLVLRRVTSRTSIEPFYYGVFEVTQKQYELVTGDNPSHFSGAMHPVEQVSRDTLVGSSISYPSTSFFGLLRLKTNVEFALPTINQWEFSCRAGTTTKYHWGDSMSNEYAWHTSNSGGSTHEVGTRKPNAWGFYDMNGNVAEWCIDELRVSGGSWLNTGYASRYEPAPDTSAGECTSSSTRYASSDEASSRYGFRVVVDLLK